MDATRTVYDPVNHWMGAKIANWIRFFGVNPDNWVVRQAGETAWIAQRPFHTLAELEKHMPQLPRYEDVRDWYQPVIRQIQQVLAAYDIVYIGAVEGPITDAYTYMDMELFAPPSTRRRSWWRTSWTARASSPPTSPGPSPR